MAVDIATLGIKVDASEADQGKLKLDALAGAGDRAQTSTRGLSNASKALNGDLGSTTGAANAAGASIGGMAGRASQAGGAINNAGGAAASMADRVARLRASVDPLGAAQDRVNDEMREAASLYAAGAMSAQDYARSMATLNTRATDLAARQTVVNARLMGGAAASRLTANEALNLSRQFADIGVTAAMGMNPLMILIQQGPQIADIMKTSGLGWRGLVREIGLFFKIIEVVPAANAAVAASNAAVVASNEAVAASAVAAATAEQQLSFAFMEAGAAGNASAAGVTRAAAANTRAAASAEAETAATVTRLGIVGRIALPLTAILGAVWLGFMAGARGANESAREVQREFGFTENQMKRLRDANTELGYSFGDVWAGVAAVVSGALEDVFGPNYLATLESYWNGFLDGVMDGVGQAATGIIAEFAGAYYASINVWNNLPRIMGDLVNSTVNVVTRSVAAMINFAIDGINGLIDMLPEWVTTRTGRINFRMEANVLPTSGGSTFTDEVDRGYAQGREAAEGIVGRAGQRFRRGRSQHRNERLREAAGDGEHGSSRGRRPRQSDEEREYAQAVRGAENYIQALDRETAAIGRNELETKRLETTRAQAEITRAAAALGTTAAIENARRLSAQMAQQQEAWERATGAEHLRVLTLALSDQADALEHETSLIGMNNEARAVAMAQREIDLRLRELERRGWEINPDLIQAETDRILANARARGRLTDATEAANRIATHMRDNANAIRETTEAFGDLFGTAGEGFANLLNTIMDFDARQAESRARLIQLQEQYNRGQMSEVEYTFQRGRVEAEMSRASIANYGNMLSAAKTFFEEGSTGWRVLEAAERVYRLFQFAMQIRSMLMDRASTASSVANSGARAAADGVAAIAKAIASLPFPLNLIAGAATAAALVAFGVKVLGGKGGGATASSSAASAVEAYTGPRDEYGAPTSSYSVLKPGATTVANDNGAASYGKSSVGNTIVIQGDKLVIEGGADQRTVENLNEMLNERDRRLVEETRQIVAQDNAERNARQRIGGS